MFRTGYGFFVLLVVFTCSDLGQSVKPLVRDNQLQKRTILKNGSLFLTIITRVCWASMACVLSLFSRPLLAQYVDRPLIFLEDRYGPAKEDIRRTEEAFHTNRYVEAERHIREAISKSPRGYSAYVLLSQILWYKHNDPRQALEAIRTSLRLQPGNAEASLHFIQMLYHRSRAKIAPTPLFNIIIEHDLVGDWQQLAFGLLADKEKHLHQAERINPDNPWTILYYALFCQRRGRLDEALEKFRRASHYSTTREIGFDLLGDFYLYSVGDPASAEYYYLKAFHINPYHHFTLAKLINLYSAQSKYRWIIELMNDRIQSLPNDPWIYLCRGFAFMNIGRYDQARQDIEDVLLLLNSKEPPFLTAIETNFSLIANHTLAEIYRRTSRFDEMHRIYESEHFGH